MGRKLRIFVSSTYEDLKEERGRVLDAIVEAGYDPSGMELFSGGRPTLEAICASIDESDVYVLIMGARYGSMLPNRNMSYTEFEYRYAMKKGMPLIVIALSDSYLQRNNCSRRKVRNVFINVSGMRC